MRLSASRGVPCRFQEIWRVPGTAFLELVQGCDLGFCFEQSDPLFLQVTLGGAILVGFRPDSEGRTNRMDNSDSRSRRLIPAVRTATKAL